MGDFVPHTDAEIEEMLTFLGLERLEQLFDAVPASIRLAGGLSLEPGISEPDLVAAVEELAQRNSPVGRNLVCFAGGGAYDHEVPAVTRALAGRSEFVTAYTPYQPEVAQGVLQAVFEYQTMIARLSGLPVANASLYDGASALVEAVNLATAGSRNQRVLLSAGVHPHWRQVLATFAKGTGHELETVPLSDGLTSWAAAGEASAGCVVVGYPNYLGCLEDVRAARALADRCGALLVVCFDPIAAGLLRPPGLDGADVVVGEGQPLGTALSFGGPYLGLFACRSEHVRRLPGRLVGETVDVDGRRAYVTTLRSREQDIRREKATSNVCTNQTLMAVTAAIQLSWLGTEGLREVALRCARATRYCREALLAVEGVEAAAPAPVLREFAVRTPVPGRDARRAPAGGRLPGGDPHRRDVGRWSGRSVDRGDGAAHEGGDRRLRGRLREGGAPMSDIEAVPAAEPAAVEPAAVGVLAASMPGEPVASMAGGSVVRARPSRAAGARAASVPLVGREEEPTVFELSAPGRRSWSLRTSGLPEWRAEELVPSEHLAESPVELTEMSERDVVGHFTRLSHRQYSVDLGAYPLGSCTMKYNPKICDSIAAMPGFAAVHPAAPASSTQGWMEVLFELERVLCEITGMAAATLQPAAGAAGELTGLLLMRAYHEAHGSERHRVIIPDSAHGTNPASVTLGGYQVTTVGSDTRGCVDLEKLRAALDEDVAGIMLTNPNTLGLFEEDIEKIAAAVHEAGGLLYYDGANLNAILGLVRPGDMGFDIVHMNLHKTFATPHGGGGPGAGPVAVGERLAPFLPGPRVARDGDRYVWSTPERSIGRIHSWHGNALVLLRALSYIRLHGRDGLQRVAETAVLNANWIRARLRGSYDVPFDRTNMHECVLSAATLKRETGVKAADIAKALLEEGFHSPTVYFPLIVEEALMIEPTETESPETLEALALALESIAAAARAGGDGLAGLHAAPRTTPVRRVDEARAARRLIATFDAR